MGGPPGRPRARRIEVPRRIAREAGFAAFDYASAFELASPGARSLAPEQWARAVFEGAPRLLRWVLLRGWGLGLGLRLGPRPSPGHVLGWAVSDAGPDTVILAAHSRLIDARNTVLVEDGRVVWVTLVRFERRAAAPLWAAAAPIHHLTVPYLLRRANRRAR